MNALFHVKKAHGLNIATFGELSVLREEKSEYFHLAMSFLSWIVSLSGKKRAACYLHLL